LTFLFADTDQSAGGGSVALEARDAALRSAIEGHGGWLVEHRGRGLLASFPLARGAVDSAVELQRVVDLPLRIGLASGDFAPTLNRASGLVEAGHAGQVLVAGSTAALLEDVDLLDLGAQRLRDLSAPQRVYQVRADGLRDSFPPLRTLTNVPGNLPAQLTSFVGREGELARLIDALGEHRLVTLTGPGGVGKTRLALHAAGELAVDYRGGAWVVELAPLSDPAAVGHAVAGALGIEQQPGRTISESVVDALAFRDVLLVLDNCEHLIDEVARLAGEIVAHCPGVTLVATSRETLAIPGEQTWPVPSLPFHDGALSPAVILFAERAAAVVPSFDLAPDVQAVSEICRRLDGIPLAIELAAARVRSLSPAQIRDRLDERFRLLTGGARRDLERHRTLRNVVEWSYDLLDEPERRLLARLSVFAGGFSLEAAEEVGAEELGGPEIVDLLDSLVRKSLVTTERVGDVVRYSLLETIRQFGHGLLVGAELEAARDRHAHFFARASQANYRVFMSARQREGIDWFENELANLRAAFRWSLDRDDVETAAIIATEAATIGQWRLNCEPTLWAIEALDRARGARIPMLAELLSAATQCHFLGRLDESRRFAEEAIQLVEHGGQTVRSTLAWLSEGFADLFSGQVVHAIETVQSGAARSEEQGSLDCTSALVVFLDAAGRKAEAVELADKLLPLARATGVPSIESFALEACAWAYGARDVNVAIDLLEDSVSMARAHGIKSIEAVSSKDLAVFLGRSTQVRRALETMLGSLESLEAAGDWGLSRHALAQTFLLFVRIDRFEAAATLSAVLDTAMLSATGGMPGLEAALARSRDALGEVDFDRLVAAGSAMQFAELVHYTVEQISLALTLLGDDAESPATGQALKGRAPVLPGGLSEREAEVLRLIAVGKTNAEIAEALVISPHTVGRHVSNIFDKLGITHRADAAAWAVRNGLAK